MASRIHGTPAIHLSGKYPLISASSNTTRPVFIPWAIAPWLRPPECASRLAFTLRAVVSGCGVWKALAVHHSTLRASAYGSRRPVCACHPVFIPWAIVCGLWHLEGASRPAFILQATSMGCGVPEAYCAPCTHLQGKGVYGSRRPRSGTRLPLCLLRSLSNGAASCRLICAARR